MGELRRMLRAQHPRQPYLPTSRSEQILSSDHGRDAMAKVVYHHGELVGPVTQPVPQQQITTLTRGVLALLAQQEIGESFVAGLDHDPKPASRPPRQVPLSAAT